MSTKQKYRAAHYEQGEGGRVLSPEKTEKVCSV
jgi:hypothetical protein